DGDMYLADEVISHVAPERTQDISKADVTITVAFDFPVLDLHSPFPSPKETQVTIYKFYDGITEPTPCFRGKVQRPNYDGSFARITCKTRLSDLEKVGMSETLSNLCPYFLGDGRCPVNLENFRVGITVTNIDGVNYTVDGITQIDTWFRGGTIVAPNGDIRFIVE